MVMAETSATFVTDTVTACSLLSVPPVPTLVATTVKV